LAQHRQLSDPEICGHELRHERTPSDDFSWAVSAFYIDLDAIGWNQNVNASTLLGSQTQWGVEVESFVTTRYCRIGGSHSYTKLIDFTLADPNYITFITAAANGFGDDLANWSNHISKVVAHAFRIAGTPASLRYYWAPGCRYRDQCDGRSRRD
jgi:hypothetical protein